MKASCDMIANLLAQLPSRADDEIVEPLLERPGLRLERIVSWGHATPVGQWYDQEQEEWVMVLSGAARMRIQGKGEYALGPGDSVLLPAHCRHRVEWTDPDAPTVWLALHCCPLSREERVNEPGQLSSSGPSGAGV
jgi:cupin 2 domain-containing protein